MSTALQLVNQVRRKMREETISSISSDDSLTSVILDELNSAMFDILESKVWPFDVRRASIITQPVLSSSDCNVSKGSPLLTVNSISGFATNPADIGGNFTWRINVSGSDDQGDVSYRVVQGTIATGTINGAIDQSWPGDIVLSGECDLFVSEYQFPQHSDDGRSQVRQLLSMAYQQRWMRLEEASHYDFDRRITRLHENLGQDPEIVISGISVIETGASSAGTDYAPGFAIWPVPTNEERLDYTYVYQHPEISSSQDLEEVPRSVEQQIVELTYARLQQSGVGNEAQIGLGLEQRVMVRVAELHQGIRRDPMRRLIPVPFGRHAQSFDEADFGVIDESEVSL